MVGTTSKYWHNLIQLIFDNDIFFWNFSCWLDYESGLLFAVFVPNTIFVVSSIMMIEAAGSVDEQTMTPLEGESLALPVLDNDNDIHFRFHDNVNDIHFRLVSGSDQIQRTSAKYMHRSLILRNGLCYVSFIVGSMADYQQNFGLYFVFTIFNGILGFLIFFFHCTSNDTVSF